MNNKRRSPFFGPELAEKTKFEASCLGGATQLTVAE